MMLQLSASEGALLRRRCEKTLYVTVVLVGLGVSNHSVFYTQGQCSEDTVMTEKGEQHLKHY